MTRQGVHLGMGTARIPTFAAAARTGERDGRK